MLEVYHILNNIDHIQSEDDFFKLEEDNFRRGHNHKLVSSTEKHNKFFPYSWLVLLTAPQLTHLKIGMINVLKMRSGSNMR